MAFSKPIYRIQAQYYKYGNRLTQQHNDTITITHHCHQNMSKVVRDFSIQIDDDADDDGDDDDNDGDVTRAQEKR